MKQCFRFLMPALLVLLIFLMGGCDLLQPAQGSKTAQDLVYDSASFDMSLGILPEKYNGHDIQKVFNDLYYQLPKKDEYETTESYNQKVIKATPTGLYAFRYEDELYTTYNADTGVLSIPILLSTGSTDSGANIGFHSTKRIEGPIKRSMGLKMKSIELYGIALYPALGEYDSFDNNLMEIQIKVSPDSAQAMREQVSLLFIGAIKPTDNPLSLISMDVSTELATASDPITYDYTLERVFVELREIWVYNYGTGEILAKVKAPKLRVY